MLFKIANLSKRLPASTLMESLVALAITTLMIGLVFLAIPRTISPISPERELEATVIADSILAGYAHSSAFPENDTFNLKGFSITRQLIPYDTISMLNIFSIKVSVGKHVLAERQRIVAVEDETKN